MPACHPTPFYIDNRDTNKGWMKHMASRASVMLPRAEKLAVERGHITRVVLDGTLSPGRIDRAIKASRK